MPSSHIIDDVIWALCIGVALCVCALLGARVIRAVVPFKHVRATSMGLRWRTNPTNFQLYTHTQPNVAPILG